MLLWAREPEVVEAINARHENALFLPGVALGRDDPRDRRLSPISTAARRCWSSRPAQHLRAVLAALAGAGRPLVLCAKGIEAGTGLLMHEVAHEVAAGERRSRCCPARPSRTRSPPACRPR